MLSTKYIYIFSQVQVYMVYWSMSIPCQAIAITINNDPFTSWLKDNQS